jgi:hypothetical protein
MPTKVLGITAMSQHNTSKHAWAPPTCSTVWHLFAGGGWWLVQDRPRQLVRRTSPYERGFNSKQRILKGIDGPSGT